MHLEVRAEESPGYVVGKVLRSVWSPRYEVDERFLPIHRTFSVASPLRQAVIFPRGTSADSLAAKRKSAAAVLHLRNGRLWAVRVPRYVAHDDSQLFRLAERLAKEVLTSATEKVLEEKLHYILEYKVEILTPVWHGDDEKTWNIRPIAIEFTTACKQDPMANAEAMALYVEDCEITAVRTLNRELSRFIDGLDDETFRGAHVAGEVSLIRYNWLVADDPEIRRNRFDIVRTLPLLVPMLSGETEDDPKRVAILSRIVDRGEPLVGGAASLFQVPKNIVRSLLKVQPSRVGTRWAKRVPALMRVLCVIAPEKRPRTESEWFAFAHACTRIEELLKRPLTTPLALSLVAAISRNGFGEGRRELRECDEMQDWFPVIEEFLDGLRLALTHAAGKDPLDKTSGALVANQILERIILQQSFKNLYQIGLRWRAEYHKEHGRLDDARALHIDAWTPLLVEPWKCDGLSVVELQSVADLQSEAGRMQNCIESYVPQCKSGASRLFSIRDAIGTSLSNFEVRLSRERTGNLKPVISQHKGFKDKKAPRSCSHVAARFLENLSVKPILARFLELHPTSASARANSCARAIEADRIRASVHALRKTLSGTLSYDTLIVEATAHARSC